MVSVVIVRAMARAESAGSSGALGPPISVLTQPGVMATTQMPWRRNSSAIARVTMLSAAFEGA
jgi:hypothetical protein